MLGITIVMGATYLFASGFREVRRLKTLYPVVRYHGKVAPATIDLVRSRPAHWVSLSQISEAALGAVIVSEDWAFFQHQGYDAKQIKEAIKEDLEQLRFARGASTITQQVARNVFLDKDKNIWRKLKEFYFALLLEKAVGKGRILEVYFNIAEWGEGIYGIRRATREYFDKHPSQLSAKEGAFLAMLLPSPKRYSQSFRQKHLTPFAREAVQSILGKMVQGGYLTEEEKTDQELIQLSFETPESESGAEPDVETDAETLPRN